MRRLRFAVVLAVTVVVVAPSGDAGAQEVRIRGDGPRALVGIVTDSAGRALDSADVYISPSNRRAVSDSVGRFRFDDLKRGKYAVSARHIGYYPQRREVTLTDTGAVVVFSLVPLVQRLPLIVKAVSRGGLSGIIGDTSYVALDSVEIWSTTSPSHRAFTDNRGTFFMDLKPGRHMVRIRKRGYQMRLMSVTIPRDSGREILVNLGPSKGTERRDLQLTQMMAERLARRSPVWSTIYTRDDISKLAFKELSSFVNAGAGRPVDESCLVNVDGLDRSIPIWAVSAADIEMIEVYAGSARVGIQSKTQSRVGSPSRRVPRGPDKGCASVFVWIRK